MRGKQSQYHRDALLVLKPQTDLAPMLFQARYVHRAGRWCTFVQLSVLSPQGIGDLNCGHINIARSVVEVHQPLGKSDHHRVCCFVARVGTYWYNGDKRAKLMLERMENLPSLWLCDDRGNKNVSTYLQGLSKPDE